MTAPTPDFYTLIHKAIRLAMSEFLITTGASDPADRAAWQVVEEKWRKIKALLDAHSRHEDTFVHPLIHRAAPEVADLLDRQHEQLDADVRALDTAIGDMSGNLDLTARRRAGQEFYRAFSAFTARYFDHLMEEETSAMPALLSNIPWDQLFAAHSALVGSMSPEQRLADLPIVARSLSSPELVALMAATRSSAPPAFFAEACRIMEGAIGEHAFARATAAMGKVA
jgi:hypothetical protein